MIGAIIGDVIGSKFESSPRYPKRPVKTKNFPLFYQRSRFTDDTVLTCATAEVLLSPVHTAVSPIHSRSYATAFGDNYKSWGNRYPDRGYGGGFRDWLKSSPGTANNSYANGAMMRCSPIALATESFGSALEIARQSVLFTHNSPESIRGVQSIVAATWMANNSYTKDQIKSHVEENYGHMLNLSLDEVRAQPKTSIRCNLTAPQALTCFMESTDFESAVRNAIYIGGDTDTNAAIAGAIAEAYYGPQSIPKNLIAKAKIRLNPEILSLVNRFYTKIAAHNPKYKDFVIV